MFVHVSDLQVGQEDEDADTLLSRILSDLVPIYKAAKGFVAYYAIKKDNDTATTIRIFEDQASFLAAVQDAAGATNQIVTDLQVTNTEHTDAEAGVASAFGPIHVP